MAYPWVWLMHMHACQLLPALDTTGFRRSTCRGFTLATHPPDVCVLRGGQQECAPRIKRLCFQLLHLPQIPSKCTCWLYVT